MAFQVATSNRTIPEGDRATSVFGLMARFYELEKGRWCVC